MYQIRPIFWLNLTSLFLLLPWLPSSLKIKSQLFAWPRSFSALIPSYYPLDHTGLATLTSLLFPGHMEHAPAGGCGDRAGFAWTLPSAWNPFSQVAGISPSCHLGSFHMITPPPCNGSVSLSTHTYPLNSGHKPQESLSPVQSGCWVGDDTGGHVRLGELILGVHSKEELSEFVINRAQLNLISCTFCSCDSGVP